MGAWISPRSTRDGKIQDQQATGSSYVIFSLCETGQWNLGIMPPCDYQKAVGRTASSLKSVGQSSKNTIAPREEIDASHCSSQMALAPSSQRRRVKETSVRRNQHVHLAAFGLNKTVAPQFPSHNRSKQLMTGMVTSQPQDVDFQHF